MQKRSDDRLIAYLDGELRTAEQREIEAWLASDPAAPPSRVRHRDRR